MLQPIACPCIPLTNSAYRLYKPLSLFQPFRGSFCERFALSKTGLFYLLSCFNLCARALACHAVNIVREHAQKITSELSAKGKGS